MGSILIPLLTAHLLSVNVAMAGPFVCVWLDWRACRHGDLLADETGRRLARDAFWSLFWAMVIGGIMAGLLWGNNDRAYFAAVWAVPDSRLWFGLVELTFSFGLLGGYAYGWNALRNRRVWHRAMALFAGANLAYHFPPLFSAIAHLADHPELRAAPVTRDAFRLLLVDGPVLSMALHVWLASVAVVGTLLLWYALQRREKTHEPGELDPQAARLAGWGAWLALVPTLLQLFAGIWVVVELPTAERNALLGDRLPLTLLFGTGLVVALRLMHVLASIALGDRTPRQLVSAIATMILTVLLMTATLHVGSRREELNLNPTFSTPQPPDSHVARNHLADTFLGSQYQPAARLGF